MSKYRFAGVPQKIAFNAGLVVLAFVPDAECVVGYRKDNNTELKFFVLTSENAECVGDLFKDVVEFEVYNGKESLFTVGNHVVMELEEESDSTKVEIKISASKFLKKDFRIVSLSK